MKKALLLAPMSSVHEGFNPANIEALEYLKFEIHLTANFELSDHDKQYKKRMNNEGLVTHQIPFVRGSFLKNLKVIPQIKELIKKEKFDMVHCHTETAGILTRLALNSNKSARYLYTPHGMSFYKGSSLKSQIVYRPIEKWICKKMDANLAMNKEELAVLKKWNKDTAKYIHGVGVDFSQIQNIKVNVEMKRSTFKVPIGARLILSVGELNENKNHKVIIEAISKIRDSDLYYMICGKGEKREELVALSKQLHVENRVIMPGYRYDVKEFYQMADVFVFPSFHEGLSVSIMEAMAAGLPVVCSKIRGNVDLIEDGKGGFLLEPRDVNGFSNAINTVLTDSELRRTMGNINLENVKNFSMDEVETELKEIYSEG